MQNGRKHLSSTIQLTIFSFYSIFYFCRLAYGESNSRSNSHVYVNLLPFRPAYVLLPYYFSCRIIFFAVPFYLPYYFFCRLPVCCRKFYLSFILASLYIIYPAVIQLVLNRIYHFPNFC